jgi:hypothetical protein
MQKLSDSIKRVNLTIMGIKEGEEVQAKGIHNIFNKVMAENFTNLRKELSIQLQDASRARNSLDQNITSPQHTIIIYREKRKNIEVSTETLKAKSMV